jgi:hypothetical protein
MGNNKAPKESLFDRIIIYVPHAMALYAIVLFTIETLK